MSLGDMFGTPSAPKPPPPPPAPPNLAMPSIMEAGAGARKSMGAPLEGTDVTGGQGAKNPTTTKTLLGG